MTFYLHKKFGDTVKVYNLNISPKLALEIPRVEFLNAAIFPGYNLSGSMRAFELNWKLNKYFSPEIVLSSGPLMLENSLKLDSAMLKLKVPKIWGFDRVKFAINTNDFDLPELLNAEFLAVDGVYDVKLLQLNNIKFSAKNFHMQDESDVMALSFSGLLNKAKLDNNYNVNSVEGFSLTSRELYSEKQNVSLEKLSATLDFEKDRGRVDLLIDEV